MAAAALMMSIPATNAQTTSFSEAAEKTVNSVVSIKNYASPRQSAQSYSYGYPSDPFFDFFFGSPRQNRQRQQQQQQPKEQQRGLGSGVIISADGYIVTNNHVVEGADRIEVTLNDNSTYNATIVGTDAATDVALLKIKASNLPPIEFGNSDSLRIGQPVLAVGNPFGFTSTVTAGIVSAKARSVSSAERGRSMGIESYIQTDAAVNPGNSGGALVDDKGRLIGINTAIYSQTGNYVGYSFAIPVSMVSKIVEDIQKYGSVQRAVLGISFRELTPQLAAEKKLGKINDGILVEEVMPNSAASEAGIAVGDVILTINNTPTHNTAQLQGEMSKYRPGDKINISYLRSGTHYVTQATLRNSKGDATLAAEHHSSNLGAEFAQPEADELARLGIKGGVEVTTINTGSPFEEAGMKEGFVIVDINGKRINKPEDIQALADQITESEDDDKVMFISGYYPTGRKAYYAVDLGN